MCCVCTYVHINDVSVDAVVCHMAHDWFIVKAVGVQRNEHSFESEISYFLVLAFESLVFW